MSQNASPKIPARKKVVIIGGGFGGLNCAKRLARLDKNLDITIFDRRNYHLFQPLLYQVATAGLSAVEIATPIRSVFSSYASVSVVLANVTELRLPSREIVADGQVHGYDHLVIACGAKHSYFNHPEWEEYAPGLKTLEQATEIRRRLLVAFERAEKTSDIDEQKKHLTFIVIGGGPTGVEMAGAIAEIARVTLKKDFRRIDPSRTRIILIEAGSRILASFAPHLSAKALLDLESMGVQVWTNTRVTQVGPAGVEMGGEKISSSTIIWAAGVQPSSLARQIQGAELDRAGRVVVRPDLSLPGHPEVFVIGDMAHFKTASGDSLPGLAPVAIQQGHHVAKNIMADLSGSPRFPFQYFDKGQMATIGRKKAVMQWRGLEWHGGVAWFAWLFVHIFYLIGFRNRIIVFF